MERSNHVSTPQRRTGLLVLVVLFFLALISLRNGHVVAQPPAQATSTSISKNWKIGDIVGLQQGMIIRKGSGVNYPINACVPQNNWLVKIISGPRFADGYIWWDVDRKVLDQLATSGTGWIAPDIATITCPTLTPTPIGGGDTIPPVIRNVSWRVSSDGSLVISADITDNVAVTFASVITDINEV